MALVNPNIAMSYRPTVEYQPRNALAEAAQIQQLVGGQRQAEMADMQLEDLRRERGVLGQIAAAISAKGGPDLKSASLLMMQNPRTSEQGYNIYQALQKQQRLEDYERRYGDGAGATTPTSAAGAITAPAPVAAPEGELVAAPITPPMGTMREIAPDGAAGAEMPLTRGANALAPAAAPASTNAMTAAQPAAPAQDVNALARRYSLAVRAGSPDAPVILKQIEAALKPDPSELRTMQSLGYPLTPAGYESFRRAQMKEAQEGAPVAVIGPDGKPTLVTRAQAVGRVPFTPAAVQVLGLGPQRETAAAGQKAPAGYRFTPTGDLEPIPGGPAARGAEPKPLTPAQEVKRRDTLGKEFKSATAALQTTQDVLDSISFVRAEPGLSRATGYTGMLPSFSEGAAASAETRLANLKGKITALGKAAAASTGAIGSIANQEWKILSDQIAAIDPVKGTGPLLKQLELVELQAQGAMARIRDAYGRQFGEDFERFPQFSDLPAPQSSFKPATPASRRAAPTGSGVDTSNPLLR